MSSFTVSQELLNAYRTINATIRDRGANDPSTETLKTAALTLLAEAAKHGARVDDINTAIRQSVFVRPEFNRVQQTQVDTYDYSF